MSNEKILKVMAEVNGEVCERGELIHGIALRHRPLVQKDNRCKAVFNPYEQADGHRAVIRSFRSCKPYTGALAVKRH